jgi:hypothetical protein
LPAWVSPDVAEGGLVREDLQGRIGTAAEVGANGSKDCEDKRKHGLTLVTLRNLQAAAAGLDVQAVDSRAEEVLPTDRR